MIPLTLPDGTTYPSHRAAARALGVTPQALDTSLRRRAAAEAAKRAPGTPGRPPGTPGHCGTCGTPGHTARGHDAWAARQPSA